MSEGGDRFRRLPGFEGLFYEPCTGETARKHPCPDCHYCQQCSAARCSLCRCRGGESGPKLSLEEQVALYERINSPEHPEE
jgi:hypothetical protein